MRHRPRQEPADWSSAPGQRAGDTLSLRDNDVVSSDFLNSDPEIVDDSLIGGDSDFELSCRSGHSQSQAQRVSHSPAYYKQRRSSPCRMFIALFDYDPATMSPNPGAIDEELRFSEGQLIKVGHYNKLLSTKSRHARTSLGVLRQTSQL